MPNGRIAGTLFIMTACALAFSWPAFAATYHVSPFGSNTPPFDTYAKAATHPRTAVDSASGYGDTVLIHAGTYDVDTAISLPLGLSILGIGADSTILNWPSREYSPHAMLEGTGDHEFERLQFRNAFDAAVVSVTGISVWPGSGSVRIRNCKFIQAGFLGLAEDTLEIIGSYFELGSGVGVKTTAVFTENVIDIHDNVFVTGERTGSPYGIQLTGTGYGRAAIRHNVFDLRGDGRGSGIYVLLGLNLTVNNNLFLEGGWPISWLYTSGDIRNNTFVRPKDQYQSLFIALESYNDLLIRNNLSLQATAEPRLAVCQSCAPGGNLTYVHNAFWPPRESFIKVEPPPSQVTVVDSANRNAYPMFSDTMTYRLQLGSPLIDAGDPQLMDPDGSRSDIGWTGGPEGSAYSYPDLPPLPPESLSATGRDTIITVSWMARPEGDLAGYRVYRGHAPGFWMPSLTPTFGSPSNATEWVDHRDRDYDVLYYVATSVDRAGQESQASAEVGYVISDHPLGAAPIWSAIGDGMVKALDTLVLTVEASDPDGDSLTLTALELGLNASFVDMGGGAGELRFTPDESQVGAHSLRLEASDGFLADTLDLTITVRPANRAPSWSPTAAQRIAECDTLIVGVRATDVDGDAMRLVADDLPYGATLIDSGNGAGSLRFTPDTTQAGEYGLALIVTDGQLADTAILSVRVVNADCLSEKVAPGIIKVFPNPVTGPFSVEVLVPGGAAVSHPVRLILHDLLGRTVAVCYEGELSTGRHIVDASPASVELATGVYFLRMQSRKDTVGKLAKIAVIR